MVENVKVNMYWCLEHDVALRFNRLKAKLFNLVEASVPDKTQQEALKGLVKGFANDEYKLCLEDMRLEAINAGWLKKEELNFPQSAEPLENRQF